MSNTNYAVIYDLHSHTIASDGRLTPEELVHRAHQMRVGTLAITDHDTVAAIPAAQREIERAGLPLALITGVEISTLWENHEIHIVGLNIDIDHPAMTALLDEQKARRQMRGQQIAERLEKARIPGAWEGALKLADGGAVTRGHFARFLVEAGYAFAIMPDLPPARIPGLRYIPIPAFSTISFGAVYRKDSRNATLRLFLSSFGSLMQSAFSQAPQV